MSNCKVLIVDDEYDLLQAIAALLKDEGYDVETFSSGPSAVKHLMGQEAQPSVILLDVMMPILSGLDVLRQLRGHDGTREVPVVMMSAADPPADEDLAWDAFLKKPFDIKKLLRTVERYAG